MCLFVHLQARISAHPSVSNAIVNEYFFWHFGVLYRCCSRTASSSRIYWSCFPPCCHPTQPPTPFRHPIIFLATTLLLRSFAIWQLFFFGSFPVITLLQLPTTFLSTFIPCHQLFSSLRHHFRILYAPRSTFWH